jgi:cytochrome c
VRTLGIIIWGFLAASAHGAVAHNAEHGRAVFQRCEICHEIGPHAENSVGPMLNGVVGRPAGQLPGYTFSAAMQRSGLIWNDVQLRRFVASPAATVPGTRMRFAGLASNQDIDDLLAYLRGAAP